MKSGFNLSLILICLLLASQIQTSVENWGLPEENDVTILTDQNFDDFVANQEWVFVKFYAPWCGHCKSMAPMYSELALEMKFKENGIAIANLEATEQKKVAEKFKLAGFPTLMLFNRGFPIDYKGGREKKDILNFIETKQRVQLQKIDSIDEFEELKGAKLAAVYYLASQDEKDIQAFRRFVLQFDNIPFVYTHNQEIRDAMNAKGKAVLFVIRNFDDGHKVVSRDQPMKDSELTSEFKKVRYGFVMEYNDDVASRVDEEKKPTVYLFTANKRGQSVEILNKLAPDYSKDFLFVVVDATDEKVKRTIEFFGVSGNEQVRLMGYKGGKNQKYKVNEVSETAVKQLLEDFKANKARQYLKTDPIPSSNPGPVKAIVGASFSDEVLKSNKHVLLEIYAPWCGHCKQMEPVYNELASQLRDYDDLVIAKMDGATNEYPKLEVSGYPTIWFYPKGKKDKPIKYEGDKNIQKFLIFLNRHIGRVHKTTTVSSEL